VYLFKDAIVIGIQNEFGDCTLNPCEDVVYKTGDSLICLAWDDDTYESMPPEQAYKVQLSNTLVNKKTPEQEVNESVLIVGWRRDLSDFLQEIHAVRKRCTEVTIFATASIEEREDLLSENCRWRKYDDGLKVKLKHVVGEPTSHQDMLSLKLDQYDTIFVVADEMFEGRMEERDGNALNIALLIADIKNEQNPRLDAEIAQEHSTNLVVEMLGTKWLTGFSQATDYVMSNSLVSSALAMVTECRTINSVLTHILDEKGCNIYLHSILEYLQDVQCEVDMAFWDIVGYVRRQNSICMGYVLEGNEESLHREIFLNPKDKHVPRKWSRTTKLVVLSDSLNRCLECNVCHYKSISIRSNENKNRTRSWNGGRIKEEASEPKREEEAEEEDEGAFQQQGKRHDGDCQQQAKRRRKPQEAVGRHGCLECNGCHYETISMRSYEDKTRSRSRSCGRIEEEASEPKPEDDAEEEDEDASQQQAKRHDGDCQEQAKRRRKQ